MSYDNACKFLAEQYPAAFMHWLLGIDPATQIQLLKTELLQEPIRADSLTFLKAEQCVVYLEFQTRPASKPPLPFRMLDYSVRLKREYQVDVEQVVLFLQQTTAAVAFMDAYQDRTTCHRYRVIRLWEQDPEDFLTSPALLN